MAKKIGPNKPCPCGSGRKYKNCCRDKGFEWVEDDAGEIARRLPIDPMLKELLDIQLEKFREQFGRDPGPDDKIFFDAPPVEHAEFELVKIMKQNGIDGALIYAFEKTGLLVTEENRDLIPEQDLAEWEQAIEEYEEKMASGNLEEDPQA